MTIGPGNSDVFLDRLLDLPRENEWTELKVNNTNPIEIGEYLSALANSAALHEQEMGYLIWGVNDVTRFLVGTQFDPLTEKKGNEELGSWLSRLTSPNIDFRFHSFVRDGKKIVVLAIPSATHSPVRFQGIAYIRIGSYKKQLKDFVEKERALWTLFSQSSFEDGLATDDLPADAILSMLDHASYFRLTQTAAPQDGAAILNRLAKEGFVRSNGDCWVITNLGAILLSNNLHDFDHLSRRAVRIVKYASTNRIQPTLERVGQRGYASGFLGIVRFINEQLPQNEQITEALRTQSRMYPEIAIRELVANALIHQDFQIRGASPIIEIFNDRIEITNPGRSLVDALRMIDEPPRSRNEKLATIMRRFGLCEERGSGLDKVIFQVEFFQLPAPEIVVTETHTKVVFFEAKKLAAMTKADRIRACYQHACLCQVSNQRMTNATLRKRFSISDNNYTLASAIIRDTLDSELIKPFDRENESKKYASYVPFWA